MLYKTNKNNRLNNELNKKKLFDKHILSCLPIKSKKLNAYICTRFIIVFNQIRYGNKMSTDIAHCTIHRELDFVAVLQQLYQQAVDLKHKTLFEVVVVLFAIRTAISSFSVSANMFQTSLASV